MPGLLHPLVLHVAAPNKSAGPRFLPSGGVTIDMWGSTPSGHRISMERKSVCRSLELSFKADEFPVRIALMASSAKRLASLKSAPCLFALALFAVQNAEE